MSMATINIKCDRCTLSGGTHQLYRGHHYRLADGRTLKAPTNVGYCKECDDICVVEDFSCLSDLNEWEQEKLQKLEKRIANPLRRLFGRDLSRRITKLVDEFILRQIALQRHNDERCLHCGSNQIARINSHETEGTIRYEAGVFFGKAPSDVIHPGCGGRLYSIGSASRQNIKYNPRIHPLNERYQPVNAHQPDTKTGETSETPILEEQL